MFLKNVELYNNFGSIRERAYKKKQENELSNIVLVDATWMFGSECLNIAGHEGILDIGSSSFTLVTNLLWPFTLAVFTIYKYRSNAIEQIKKETGRDPSPQDMEKINRGTAIFAITIFSAISMWELGAFVAPLLGITASVFGGPAGTLMTGLVIGLFAGFGAALANFICEYMRCQNCPDEEFQFEAAMQESLKVFVLTFITAASWYYLSLIPSISGLSLFMHNIMMPVIKATLIYCMEKILIFPLYQLLDKLTRRDPTAQAIDIEFSEVKKSLDKVSSGDEKEEKEIAHNSDNNVDNDNNVANNNNVIGRSKWHFLEESAVESLRMAKDYPVDEQGRWRNGNGELVPGPKRPSGSPPPRYARHKLSMFSGLQLNKATEVAQSKENKQSDSNAFTRPSSP